MVSTYVVNSTQMSSLRESDANKMGIRCDYHMC